MNVLGCRGAVCVALSVCVIQFALSVLFMRVWILFLKRDGNNVLVVGMCVVQFVPSVVVVQTSFRRRAAITSFTGVWRKTVRNKRHVIRRSLEVIRAHDRICDLPNDFPKFTMLLIF